MKYLVVILSLIIIACNTNETSSNPNGIGPITELNLKPINDSLMQRGRNLFDTKCSACHTMELKNIGPDISDILATKKPEWVMNFMLNKDEMLQKDVAAIKTLQQYQTKCGSENLTENEALELLEYLRIYQIWLHEINALYKK